MDSQAMVPLTQLPATTQLDDQQEQDLRDAIALLSTINDPRYHVKAASFAGVTQYVSTRDLWISPLYRNAMRYQRDAFTSIAGSLSNSADLGNDGLLEPLIATPIPNPQRRAGAKGQTLLVISGARRLEGFDHNGTEKIEVLVRAFNSFFDAMMATVTAKLSTGSTTQLQTGRLLEMTEIAHATEQEYRKAHNLPLLAEYPTQAKLAAKVGLDQSTVSVCRRLVDQPEDILRLVDGNMLSNDRLRDLLMVENEDQRRELATQWAALAVAGTPVSRDDARAAIKLTAERQKKAPKPDTLMIPPPDIAHETPTRHLWLTGYPAQSFVALGVVAHEMETLLYDLMTTAQAQSLPLPPAWEQMLRLLNESAFALAKQQARDTVAPDDTEETEEDYGVVIDAVAS